MNPFDRARRKALEIRSQLLEYCLDDSPSSGELLDALEEVVDLAVEPVPRDHFELGTGDANLKRSSETIFIRNDVSLQERAYLLAHELGHWYLDFVEGQKTLSQLAMLNPQAVPGSSVIVEGYGAWERQELQANVFARELLLPRRLAHDLWRKGLRSQEISKRLSLPLELVRQQLADALLLPDIPIPTAAPPHAPSSAQKIAAEASERFVNVVAGPGTGKTTTLVQRITHLISKGVPANKILVLTFTTRAAQELVERLRVANVPGASQVWAGTFHALGLEFLRKYHKLFELTPQIRVADDLQQVRLMVKELPNVQLKHYLRLQNPYDWLPTVLKIISRLKEELVTPDDYARILTQLPLAEPDIALEREDIENLYRVYQEALKKGGWVDYTDLLVILTRQAQTKRDTIQLYLDQFEHVLVDEYQDVTYVMVELVKLLGTATKNLWVVGDVRQAIHHWRGASIQSLIKFEQAFAKGASSIRRYSLDVNRRSTPEILKLVDLAGRQHRLQTTIPADLVAPSRGESGHPPKRFQSASDRDQTLTLAQQILSAHAEKIEFRDQCVISATNPQIDELAVELTKYGIPTLHIGDILQRPPIQRFLCLMQLLCHRSPTALWGLRNDPLLGMPTQDIEHLVALSKTDLQWQRGRWIGKPTQGLSPEGDTAKQNLARLLRNVKWHNRPWDFVCDLIFERGFGIPDIDDETTERQIERLALWLFLYSVRNGDGSASQATLSQFLIREDMRRRIDQRPDRTLPPEASAINAVRLMTIHGSKGLEFPVVHLPNVDNRRFGANRVQNGFGDRKQLLLPPEVLNSTADERQFEEAVERNNLLYVALSRAKDRLNIYTISDDLPACVRNKTAVQQLNGAQSITPKQTKAKNSSVGSSQIYPYAAIESLIGCPKQFHYTHELRLPGEQEIDVSMKARSALLAALEKVFKEGAPSDPAFIDVWTERGLPTWEADPNLFVEALNVFGRGIEIQASSGSRYKSPQLSIIEGVKVEVPWMLEEPDGTLHWLSTNMSVEYLGKNIRPLMINLGGKQQSHVTVHSLTNGRSETFEPSGRPGNTNLVKAVKSLASGRRLPVKGKQCNRCAYRAICSN